MKRLLALLVTLDLVSVCIVACGMFASASGSGSNGSGSSVTPVHMGMTNFLQSSVTINRGSTLNLVNDASAIHIIGLGQWVNGSPKPETEPGVPQVNNLLITGNASKTIGPWNTPGTYHLYCSIHQNMQLTVIVK